MEEAVKLFKTHTAEAITILIVGFVLGWVLEREIMAQEVSEVMTQYENKVVCEPLDYAEHVQMDKNRKCWVVRKFVHPMYR